MENKSKTVKSSKVSISELMLPSNTNFSGKIHGGYILSLLDQIAFACASKFSGNYCVTASVDTSMEIGIRVEAENIQTGKIKHCNSSYFTMVAKDTSGENTTVPKLILSSLEEVRRFYYALKIITSRKDKKAYEVAFDYKSKEALENLINYNVVLQIV